MSALTSKEFVLNTMRKYGETTAKALQENADTMTGTELHKEIAFIPSFYAALAKCNMLQRKAGFVCRTPQGNVVRLIQPYDSDIYKEEPEQLTAQWGFKWSTDPKLAKPFMKSAESPYGVDECCIWEDGIYASTMPNSTYSPAEYQQGWRFVCLVEEIQ